jgi:hypothetical protein
MELGRCVLDFLWSWRRPRIILDFIHVIPQQGPNPRLDVALGDQHNNWFVLTPLIHAGGSERI